MKGKNNNVNVDEDDDMDIDDMEEITEPDEDDDVDANVKTKKAVMKSKRTSSRRRRANNVNDDAEDADEDEDASESDVDNTNNMEEDENVEDEEDDSSADSEEEEEDNSSDMDVTECEKKRFEFVDDLNDLEKQFAILREQLYRERITQIEAKLEEVKEGKAAEYLQPLEELQVNMKHRLEVGSVLRELRLSNIQCKHDAETLATEQNFLSEKSLLWDSIKADLEEKIHMLEEDKHNVDFSSGLWEINDGNQRYNGGKRRKADPLDPDRRKKPVTVTGPYIVYMLAEELILDDWTVIKKSLSQRKK